MLLCIVSILTLVFRVCLYFVTSYTVIDYVDHKGNKIDITMSGNVVFKGCCLSMALSILASSIVLTWMALKGNKEGKKY